MGGEKNNPKIDHLEIKGLNDLWKVEFYADIIEELCRKYLIIGKDKINLFEKLQRKNEESIKLNKLTILDVRINIKEIIKEYGLEEDINEIDFLVEERINKEKNKENEDLLTNLDLMTKNSEDMAEDFYKKQPYFYDDIGLFWFWNNKTKAYETKDEFQVMNRLKELSNNCNFQVTSNKFWTESLRAIKLVGRNKNPKEFKKTWIQFKDEIFDYETNEIIEANPKYFNVNPIPHKLGKESETPEIDKLFEEWVGKDYLLTLKETIALGCLQDYPLHRIIILFGKGLNGKGVFLRFLNKFIGLNNICSSNLNKLIKNNFETAKLYKKLICCIGETDFSILTETTILKQLSGQDLISAEFKNKNSFDFQNYSTIFIASNSLPITTDKTEGFYRRPLIIDFNNQFKEGSDPLKRIPKNEYNNFCNQICLIIKNLIERGKFDNDGCIETRKNKYEERSNPLITFIKENYIEDINGKVPFWIFHEKYTLFCKERGFRELTKIDVSKSLRNNLGFEDLKQIDYKLDDGSYKQWKCIIGLSDRSELSDRPSTYTPLRETKYNSSQKSKRSQIEEYKIYANYLIDQLKKQEIISISHFIDLFKAIKVKEEIVNNLIEKLKFEGVIFEPRNGYLKLI